MFSVDLDHLNLLVMLILAFFSFRAYNSDTLAIEYQPETENKKQENVQVNQQKSDSQQNVVQVSQMNAQPVHCQSNTQNIVQDQTLTQNPAQINVIQSLESHSELSQNKAVEVGTVESFENKIDEQSLSENADIDIEKAENDQSTLVNGFQNKFSEEIYDEQENDLSSDDPSSIGSSEVSSENEEDKELSKKDKRKRIIKEKKKLKKILKREQRKVQYEAHVIQIQ